MKKLILMIPLLALTSYAQVNTNVPPSGLQDFGNTVFGYLTAFNTNLDSTFGSTRFDLWMGAVSSQNDLHHLMNNIGGSYDLIKFHANTNSETSSAISLEVETRNDGVAGSLVSVQGGPAFSLIIHDVKLTLSAHGGGYLDKGLPTNERWYGEIDFKAKKAWGRHFYGGVGMGVQFPRNDQLFFAEAGATF